MKKNIGIVVCLINLIICCSVYASASEQRVNCGLYDLEGVRQRVVNIFVHDFLVKDENGGNLVQEEIPKILEISDNILSTADDNENFIIIDMKTDNEENPYPEIEATNVTVGLPQSTGGIAERLGKDYRLFFAENETAELTDITDRISNSNNSIVVFEAEKLGTYVLYFNPAVYGVVFYAENPIYDEYGNLTNVDCIYKEINDLQKNDIIEFPPIPEKDGYVFTGWKAWSGSGIYFTEPQPHTALNHAEYYASWCPEDEYEPIGIEVTSDSAITKGKENGHKITLKTDYGIFVSDNDFPAEWRSEYDAEEDEQVKADIISEWKSKWNVVGSDDIMIESAQRVDDKTVELTLSGSSSDIYSSSEIFIEFDSSLLMPEPYEENGEIIDWNDTKIKMDSDGVKAKMYRTDNSAALQKQSRPGGSGGVGGSTRYTVTFDTNGGSETAKQTVNKNAAVKEPSVPAKEGYTFAGWFEDKELLTKYDFNTKLTTNLTLYAKWEKTESDKNTIILTVGKKDVQLFGEMKSNDVAPLIRDGRTMLPTRIIAESLGAVVEWDNDAEQVKITKGDITIIITINSRTALINGETITLDSVPFVENDRTYTPIRFISERLGASVDWEPQNQVVTITKSNQ